MKRSIVKFLENQEKKFEQEIAKIDAKIVEIKNIFHDLNHLDIFIDTHDHGYHKCTCTYVVDDIREADSILYKIMRHYQNATQKYTISKTGYYSRPSIRIEWETNESESNNTEDLTNQVATNLEVDIEKEIGIINNEIHKSVEYGDSKFIINIFVPIPYVAYGISPDTHNYHMYFIKNKASIKHITKYLYDYYTNKQFDVEIKDNNLVVIYYKKQNKENKDMGKLLDEVISISKGETNIEFQDYKEKIDRFIKESAKEFKSVEIIVLIEGETICRSDMEDDNTICIITTREQRSNLCKEICDHYTEEEFVTDFDGSGVVKVSWDHLLDNEEEDDNE